MKRILYFSHDITVPRGGIGELYEHVAVLRRHGFDAFIVHSAPKFRYPFGPPDVPVLAASTGLGVSRDDILVIPEDHKVALGSCRDTPCKKVLFCQNHFYIFDGLAPGEAWKDFGFSGYLCVSNPIQQAMRTWFGVDANVVRPGVDPIFFDEVPPRADSPITIACMPRKGRDTLSLVQGLLAVDGFAQAAGLSWIEIDGMSREQVAAHLRKSHIFVSTGRFDGLGLPPLEAMGAQCIVVGFVAGGGLDYASDENGVWVTDDDPWALTAALRQTVVDLSDPSTRPALIAKCTAGHATALKYNRAQFERDLILYWTAWR